MTTNTELDNEQQADAEAARFAALPADFPRPANLSAVAGAQPKFSITRYRGRFYSPGCTPPELTERWNACEDLAQQLGVQAEVPLVPRKRVRLRKGRRRLYDAAGRKERDNVTFSADSRSPSCSHFTWCAGVSSASV